MADSFQRIQAANIAGQARPPRFIQSQLRKLHDALVTSSKDICQAIANDSGHTAAETQVEFFLAIKSVKDHYNEFDFQTELDVEYAVANGKNSPERASPVGIVYIVPSQYTLLYSVVSPLAAAIAAGNCVILELETTLSGVSALLRKLLPKTLDTDTFAILETRPSPDSLVSCTQVFGTFQSEVAPNPRRIISPSNARVVAVVDRTADLERAADALVKARFGFGGRSPYGPDLVLVNEFVAQEFRERVVEHAARAFARNSSSAKAGERKEKEEEFSSKEGNVVVVAGSHGTVVNVLHRTSRLLGKKLNKPLFLIHTISSLDDAIDFSNKGENPLLATYLFAAPPSAKYLSQFIPSQLSLINHIPTPLLIGPASPSPASHVSSHRYPKSLFQLSAPAFVVPSSLAVLTDKASTKDLEKLALEPLKKDEQRLGGQIGFFEQGILTGLVTLLVPAVAGVVTLGALGGRMVLRSFEN